MARTNTRNLNQSYQLNATRANVTNHPFFTQPKILERCCTGTSSPVGQDRGPFIAVCTRAPSTPTAHRIRGAGAIDDQSASHQEIQHARGDEARPCREARPTRSAFQRAGRSCALRSRSGIPNGAVPGLGCGSSKPCRSVRHAGTGVSHKRSLEDARGSHSRHSFVDRCQPLDYHGLRMNQGISRKHKDVRGVDEESTDRLQADLRWKDGDGEKETG